MRIGFALLLGLSLFGCRHPEEGTVRSGMLAGGRERSFLYRLPPGHTTTGETKWPMVVMLHGRLGDGINMEKMSEASEAADRHGFVVVYPDGIDRAWNDSRGTTKASEENVDDVGFIDALIERFIALKAVDPDRVYVAGMSNGGILAYRLACELGDRIAAISPVAALMPSKGADACRPARPVSVMIVAGTDDPIVPYDGGSVLDRGTVLSADETRTRWAMLDGCAPAAESRSDEIHELRHTQCGDDAEVVLYSVQGGGHAWPGGNGAFPELIVGRTSMAIDTTEEQLRFFERHHQNRRP